MSLTVAEYVAYAHDTRDAAPAELWNLPISHWSPSSLDKVMRCPQQWSEYYLHGKQERPTEAPLIGTAVHAAIEENFRQKIDSHKDMEAIDILDLYAEEIFPQTIFQEQEQAQAEVRWDTDPERARSRGRVMLAEYHGNVAPRVEPEAVELKIEVDLGLPVPVQGRFDVRRAQSVIDVKTGSQKTMEPRPHWRLQAIVYAEAEHRPVEFHSVVATKTTHTVSIVTPLESEAMLMHPSFAERQEAIRQIRAISDLACFYMSKYGMDPWPTHGTLHVWACKKCGYIKDCPAWQGRL